MTKKGLTTVLVSFLILFYMAIVMYFFFAILKINTLANFATSLTFEIIGFVLLAFFVTGNLVSKPLKTGYFIPLVTLTVAYTVILDLVNLYFVKTLSNVFFVLINLVLLFVYCVIAIPMYIMGKKE